MPGVCIGPTAGLYTDPVEIRECRFRVIVSLHNIPTCYFYSCDGGCGRGEFQRTHYDARDEAEIARSEESGNELFYELVSKMHQSIFQIIVKKIVKNCI